MTKKIRIVIDDVRKSEDANFVNETVNNIIESLYDHPKDVSKILIDKTRNSYIIEFQLRVSKTGDLIFILIKEWLALLLETEHNILISLTETEENADIGITYKFFIYCPSR